jgi:hypothetical protein
LIVTGSAIVLVSFDLIFSFVIFFAIQQPIAIDVEGVFDVVERRANRVRVIES